MVAPEADVEAEVEVEAGAERRLPTVGAAVGGLLALTGFVLGAGALSDNSLLTHIATGRVILDTGGVPGADPYTFTAQGEPWVVQSWFVSLLYAIAEELAGPAAIRAVAGVLFAALVVVLWALARPATSVVVRAALVGLVLLVGTELWSARPLLLGLLLLGATLLAVERSWWPWLLAPAGWLWANSHGSFPLGLALLVLLAVGRRLDEGRWGREPRYLLALVVGVLAGVIGPLGPGLLLFPVRLVTGAGSLSEVVEWQAPTFVGWSQRLFLVQVVVAVGLLARRPTWRAGLPMAVFVVAALLSMRNVAVASIVLVPAMAAAVPSVGTLRSDTRSSMARVLVVVLVVATPLIALGRLSGQSYSLAGRYPLEAMAWAEEHDTGPLDGRLATQDFVGNLVNLLWGPNGATFFDDRFDMLPEAVADDYLVLLRGQAGWDAVLGRYEIDAVVWQRSQPLAQLLVSDGAWTVRFADERWILATRR